MSTLLDGVSCKHELFTVGVACGETLTGLPDEAPCKQESFISNVACGETGNDAACGKTGNNVPCGKKECCEQEGSAGAWPGGLGGQLPPFFTDINLRAYREIMRTRNVGREKVADYSIGRFAETIFADKGLR